MNVKSFEKKEKNTAEVVVEVSAAKFEAAIDAAYKKNKHLIAIPGFRKGKAPRKMVENMYGASVFYEDALEEVYPTALSFAITEKEISMVGQPSVLDVNIADDKTVTVTFGVALYPEVTMGEYKNIKAVKAAAVVTDEEVAEELERVRKRSARIQVAERPAQLTDTVNLDYEGFVDGVPFEGGKDTGYRLVLGSSRFVPGFEDQLIGVSAGDEKDVVVTFPEDYHAEELAGKEAVFKVKVNEVKENLLPELDDEFAKDVSEFDTLEEYKADLKKEMEKRKESQNEIAFKDAVMDKVLENMEGDIPDAMIEDRIDITMRNYEQNLAAQGMNLETYMSIMGGSIADFRENLRPTCERQVKVDVALEKIATLENLEVSDEEAEEEYKNLATRYNMDVEEIKKGIDVGAIKSQLVLEKAQQMIYDTAVAEEEKPKKAPAKKKSTAKKKEAPVEEAPVAEEAAAEEAKAE